MLLLQNVCKSYGSKVAVDNITVEVNDGEIVGFIGPNGAGKTTTIKMITGILNQDSGKILVNGIDISQDPIAAKRQIGFVPDNPDMFLRLKGIEYLNFMADIYDVPSNERAKRINELSQTFEISDALNNKILSYSHGMRQKIVIAAVLLHQPPVWVLDEPLTGLDPKAAFLLKELMRRHVLEGKCVFFSTHVLEVAEKLCHRVVIINKGQIIFYGTVDELRAKYNKSDSLEQIFLEVTGHE